MKNTTNAAHADPTFGPVLVALFAKYSEACASDDGVAEAAAIAEYNDVLNAWVEEQTAARSRAAVRGRIRAEQAAFEAGWAAGEAGEMTTIGKVAKNLRGAWMRGWNAYWVGR